MRAARQLLLVWVLSLLLAVPAAADLLVVVDISQQKMAVHSGGRHLHTWDVSTARPGKRTPRGSFRPQSLRRVHYSSIYNNAAMPHSIFFHGNYAIHGTTQVSHLGRPASAGCVRLAPQNAATLFDYVRRVGAGHTRIVIRD